jgi:hypothetical protein
VNVYDPLVHSLELVIQVNAYRGSLLRNHENMIIDDSDVDDM